jgi:broad specificity phosphatase PhoE
MEAYMVPAILTDDKIVTGPNHGDAFSKLTEKEKNGDLKSGFLDCKKLKFVSDENQIIYLKEIIILRHAESPTTQENGPLTELGRKQAETAAKFLTNMQLQGFVGFCSPYYRCTETSAIISENCPIPFLPCTDLSKRTCHENDSDFCNRLMQVLDFIPEKSILVTHTDFIQNVVKITHCISNIGKITNCSVTYIIKNRIIWLAREIQCSEKSKLTPDSK